MLQTRAGSHDSFTEVVLILQIPVMVKKKQIQFGPVHIVMKGFKERFTG
jgi:hypothetical protein